MKKPIVGFLAIAGIALVAALAFFATAQNSQSATIAINGMTCPACAEKIAGALQNLQGVTAAQVNYEQKAAQVQFDPAVITMGAMETEISKLGYGTPHLAAQPDAKKCDAEKSARMDCCAPPPKRSDT